MAHPVTKDATDSSTLLLFGPGATSSFDHAYFSTIVLFMKSDTTSLWALHAIDDIERSWDSLCKAIPKLQQTPGASHARKLADWLRTGVIPPQSTVANLPNAILGPIVIIAQLVEYLRHVDSTSKSGFRDGQGFNVPSPQQTEAIGCCLGVFSAIAVSSSSSWPQLFHNAAAILRVVFVLGALSDAQDAMESAGPSVSLIAFWRGGQSVADVKKILEKYPEAYISVLYDDNRATITTTARTASALKDHLQAAGITANETEFHGRFHAGQLYESDLQSLFLFCQKLPTFQIPDASSLVLPTRINRETLITGPANLIEAACRAFLVEQFNWIKAFRSAVTTSLKDRNSRVIEFGPERCVPPTLLRRLNSQITHFDFKQASSKADTDSAPSLPSGVAENDIAVIGMSCSVAGAPDLEQYWKILSAGQSQHRELIPNDRFVMESSFRPHAEGDEKRKWYGNFIDDHDAFDYKFFKKSPREALHMDPQQRLILQTAYQAVAQSGYYHNYDSDKRIGCYIGLVANDYENNISHTTPNAFSATGALRSYVAGKVSHYFGWTGPGMTLDTACSASTVAITLACQSILSGECSAALAGGTNFYSTPMFFQNLAAGSFLSPSGQCKPFDADADGYCRGEAIGAVFLKRLSNAIADGDQVLGVISATAINQNQNTTPIFVPNPLSLTDVFRTVIKKSSVAIKDISVVEAHGTGTPVGDPAEYDSIRQVFGGSARPNQSPLQIGSVKGLVGHTEGASGVIALIKILLMMHESRIPPQASFKTINPSIKALPTDNMEISKKGLPWETDFKAALINNYGAAGSNASMVIKQAPQQKSAGEHIQSLQAPASSFKLPFYISALDDKSLRAYAARLRQFIKAKTLSGDHLGIENLAFNLNRQSNWHLGRALVFASDSVQDLDQKLASFETLATPTPLPVILCFGGQVSKFVGLDREVFDKSFVLRHHLDLCNDVCKSIGAGNLYPGIFQREPIDDSSVLQPLLFAIQYSSAMSWIDCGVKPAALIGHSFGELTALCVSGVLGLEDALKLIYGRSKAIKDSWGPEKGAMMAIEADVGDVEKLLVASNARLGENDGKGAATIACFNGPRSFTVAGSVAAIDGVQESISARSSTDPVLRHKRLDVTNAFHSVLVDNLKQELEALSQKLSFDQPKIPLERSILQPDTGPISAKYVAEHMRQPVYFDHAVQRLAKQYPEAIWLEAGSSSSITTMASKALGLPERSTFQPVNITNCSQPLQQLVNATMSLWKAGLRVSFWPHSRTQTHQYSPIIVPPYQFEKQRHWLEFKPPQKQIITEAVPSDKTAVDSVPTVPTTLYTLLSHLDDNEKKYRFAINTNVKQYVDVVSQHVISKTSQSCPVTFEIDMAIQAITSIRPALSQGSNLHPQIFNIVNEYPIFVDASRTIFLDFERLSTDTESWMFKFVSRSDGADESLHMKGQLYFQQFDEPRSNLDFSRFERLVTHERYLQAMQSDDDSEEVIQGQSIYKVFSDVVNYGKMFRGLQKVVGRSNESAGKVLRKRSDDTWLDFTLSEVFTQVSGIWANCMARDRLVSNDTVYVISGIEQWMRSPDSLRKMSNGGYYDRDHAKEWHVLAQHKINSAGKSFTTDVFVFESASGSLEEVILGVQYMPFSTGQLMKGSTSHIIATPTPKALVGSELLPVHSKVHTIASAPSIAPWQSVTAPVETEKTLKKPEAQVNSPKKNAKVDLWLKLQPVLADISGLELDEIKETDSLADIGIDSLMGMEMARDVETTFNCTLEQSELVAIVDVPGIISFLQSTLGLNEEDSSSVSSDTASSGDSPPSSQGALSSQQTSGSEGSGVAKTYVPSSEDFSLPSSTILEAFRESKALTDYFLKSYGVSGYLEGISLKQTRLCLVLTARAFKQLGCDLEAAKPGEVLQAVPCVAKHQRFHEYIYKMLEDTRIINIDDDTITRTNIPLPSQSAETILEELLGQHGDHGSSHQLAYNVGSRMADVFSGKADGPQLVFGDAKNRELVADFYGQQPFNKLYFEQMADFLTRLATKVNLSSHGDTTLKILEMGAGTGGTTKMLIPALVKLGIPFEYTFTDLSPSLIAQAKRKFKQYPMMKFAVHDIEKPPSDADLVGSQHIVIASNAVHATHSLNVSGQNIRKFLRPDGFLMLLEMMATLHWVDVVWGTLEGWWLFDDGRTHAIVNERRWESELLGAGYKHVEWTDGELAENRVQRILIALAADVDQSLKHLPKSSPTSSGATHGLEVSDEDMQIRKKAADNYVKTTAEGFAIPKYSGPPITFSDSANSILVTGGTGSLGSHIVAHLARLPSVDTVYCLNRPGPRIGPSSDPLKRQIQALENKGIKLDESMLNKLEVIGTDASKPRLGLDADQYDQLSSRLTHIIHNAFPVNGLLTMKQNEPQYAIMRNLIDFAAGVAARRKSDPSSTFKFTFQFVSSQAAVGRYPYVNKGKKQVPEEAQDVECALPNGYGGAKVVCERVLVETLGKHPDYFRSMTVRLGQLSGSTETGYWNHMEVLGFLFKSAQTLRAFPAVKGVLSWLPLEDASATLADLILRDGSECYPFYHVDNPVLKEWDEVIPVLAEALDIPNKGIVSLQEWLRRVRLYPGEDPWDNPAAKTQDFFEHKFLHMSCGGIYLATDRAREHSPALRAAQPVSDDLVRKYIQAFKTSGFLR